MALEAGQGLSSRHEVFDAAVLSQQLRNQGFCVVPGAIPVEDREALQLETDALEARAREILARLNASGESYPDFYRSSGEQFIVVPEVKDPSQACRFEYIHASSDFMRQQVTDVLLPLIELLTGHELTLFKDKCNLKAPGGGAFTAHQDIPAYLDFGPQVHITAAVFVDAATQANGALLMAPDFRRLASEQAQWRETLLGPQPVLPMTRGGTDNGRIVDSVESRLHWEPLYANPGDVVLFNSYVPHKSAINQSRSTRRAFFFTFNFRDEGEHYERYYQLKRADFGNPRFHIATPTRHDSAAD